MLPVMLQFIVATIAYAINERMARKVRHGPSSNVPRPRWRHKPTLVVITCGNPDLLTYPSSKVSAFRRRGPAPGGLRPRVGGRGDGEAQAQGGAGEPGGAPIDLVAKHGDRTRSMCGAEGREGDA
jgi:hypothetical protein